jgi:hypothetical protein
VRHHDRLHRRHAAQLRHQDTCSSDTCDSIAGCIHNPAGLHGAFCPDLLGTIIGTADDNLIQGKRQQKPLASIIARSAEPRRRRPTAALSAATCCGSPT